MLENVFFSYLNAYNGHWYFIGIIRKAHNQYTSKRLTGQIELVGDPNISTMRSIWWSSDLPGSNGRLSSNSASIHPADLKCEQNVSVLFK